MPDIKFQQNVRENPLKNLADSDFWTPVSSRHMQDLSLLKDALSDPREPGIAIQRFQCGVQEVRVQRLRAFQNW